MPAALSSSASERTVARIRSRSAAEADRRRSARRQLVGDGLQLGDFRAALRAAVEVLAEADQLLVLERTEDVRGGVRELRAVEVRFALAHVPTASQPWRWPRSLFSPRRMRPFTVPTGVPSIEAISRWVKPPK